MEFGLLLSILSGVKLPTIDEMNFGQAEQYLLLYKRHLRLKLQMKVLHCYPTRSIEFFGIHFDLDEETGNKELEQDQGFCHNSHLLTVPTANHIIGHLQGG